MIGWAHAWSGILRILCVLSLVMVGFAHKPAVAAPIAVQFAAYVLPDGTLPTFCLTDNGSKPSGMVMNHGCDACRLSAAIIVQNPPQIGAIAISYFYAAPVLARQTYLVQRLYPPSSGPRAPPVHVSLT